MNIGVCRIELRIPENHSLKGKRQIVKSIIARLQNRYSISIAEVDNNNLWQIATLGVSCVSNNRRHADTILANVVNFITRYYPNVELLNYEVEIISVL
jgi:uncharacterized protein YlxP (DUF503 family)